MGLLVNFLLFGAAHVCLSHCLVLHKKCPDVEPVDNFNLNEYAKGTWYSAARYPNEFETANCSSFELIPKGDKLQFIPHTAENGLDDGTYFINGFAPGAGTKAILLHTATFGDPEITMEMREYMLAVDYKNYYISYECKYDEKTKVANEYAWIGVRSRDVSEEVKKEVENLVKSSKVLDINKFIWLDLSNKSC